MNIALLISIFSVLLSISSLAFTYFSSRISVYGLDLILYENGFASKCTVTFSNSSSNSAMLLDAKIKVDGKWLELEESRISYPVEKRMIVRPLETFEISFPSNAEAYPEEIKLFFDKKVCFIHKYKTFVVGKDLTKKRRTQKASY